MNKKYALSLLMTCAMSMNITLTTDVHTDTQDTVSSFELLSAENLIFASAVAFISPYLYNYWTDNAPQCRYNLDELFRFKNVLKNIYYYWFDEINGTHRIDESIKLKGENDKTFTIETKPGRPATGKIGKLHANHKKILTIAGFVSAVYAIIKYKSLLASSATNLLTVFKNSQDSFKFVFTDKK